MGSSRKIRPKIEHYRVNAPDFRDLEEVIRYKGTHLMRKEMHWIKEITIQTAVKSFSSRELKDHQENFLTKMQDLRFVNGFNDVDDLSMSEIQQQWHQTVLVLIEDLNDVDVFDFEEERYVMEINVAKITEHHIDLERLLYTRARGPYD